MARFQRLPVLSAILLAARIAPAAAEEPASEAEPIVITATRIREDVAQIPASVTVVGGKELRDRGAKDLTSALALAAGMDIPRGSDAGPAGVTPEFWGVREVDAFLLVVDGVPWGGAFNPDLPSIDLEEVERIEVIRGAAPVMYGASSFVAVINVIRKAPSEIRRSLEAFAGSYGSRGLEASAPLGDWGPLQSALRFGAETQGFRDPRTSFTHDRADWRGRAKTDWGLVTFDADAHVLRQKPASPVALDGTVLTSKTPLDANQNPLDAHLDEDRVALVAGLDRDFDRGQWSTRLSYAHTQHRDFRGFVTDLTGATPDAHGFRESIGVTDLWFDSHAQWFPLGGLKLVGGLDHAHGRGSARGGDFDYTVNFDGSAAPGGGRLPPGADIRITDQRDFSGLYAFAEWEPAPSWVAEAGARLNRTEESRSTSNRDLIAGTLATGSDHRALLRGAGSVGLTWKAWSAGRDLVDAFADWRDTYKPAAMDFGLDSQSSILAPETAQSWEAGLKSRWLDDRVDANVSLFQNDMRNLLVPITIGGNPAFTNAGQTRQRGLELETSATLAAALRWQGAYSLHDARYRSFVQDFGAGPVNVGGNRMEMAARNMVSTGLTWAPPRGFVASARVNDVGSRFLDRRNTALARAYATWSAGAGWRGANWELRLDGTNLNDQRPPVSESELGDGQFYLLPARRLDLRASWNF